MILSNFFKPILNFYSQKVCEREFKNQIFSRFNERPCEFSFVFRKISELYPKHILDVGTGTTALPHLMRNCGSIVTAIDNVKDYWPKGMFNRHYHILDDDITRTRLKQKFDLITCISVLEHIKNSEEAVRNMLSLLNVNGSLLLTLPYSERKYIPNVYELENSNYGKGNPFITQSYCRENVNRWLEFGQVKLVDQEYWQFWEGDYWTQGKQIIPPRKVLVNEKHQISCLQIKRCRSDS